MEAHAEATGLRLRWNNFRDGMYAHPPRLAVNPEDPPVDENEVRRLHRALVRRLIKRLLWLLAGDILVGCVVYLFSCWIGSRDSFAGKTTNIFADAFYFSSTTLTTTGFGDDAPVSDLAKILTSFYIVLNSIYINFYIYPLVGHILELIEGRGFVTKGKVVMGYVYAVMSILIGVPCLICLGGFSVGNAFYTVIVSFSSTGFGDYSFVSIWARIFGSVWLQISHLVNCRACGLVAEAGDQRLVREYALVSNSALERTVAAQTAAHVLKQAKNDHQMELVEVHNQLVEAAHVLEQAKNDHWNELVEVQNRLVEAQTSLYDHQKQLVKAQNQLVEARTSLDDHQNQLVEANNAARNAANEFQIEAKALQDRADKSDSEAKELQALLAKANSDAEELRVQLAQADSEAKQLQAKQLQVRDKEVKDPPNQAEADAPKTASPSKKRLRSADKEVKQAEAVAPKTASSLKDRLRSADKEVKQAPKTASSLKDRLRSADKSRGGKHKRNLTQ